MLPWMVLALLLLAAVLAEVLHKEQAFDTCSKTYGSYVLITQTGVVYSSVDVLCGAYGAVPASINSVNWSSLLNLYTWCGIGALPSSLSYPWIGGGQTAGSCPVLTSLPGNTAITTVSVPCDGGQTRPLLCQSVPVQTNVFFTLSTLTSSFPFTTSTSTTTTTTSTVTIVFTTGTTTSTSTLTVVVTVSTTRQVNTATTSTSTTTTTFVVSTSTSSTTTSTTTGTVTTVLTSLRPRTVTQSASTRVTITTPTLTQITCVTPVSAA